MSAPLAAHRRFLVAICFAIVSFLSSQQAALGQESIVANARYSSVNVLDLATQNLTEAINSGYIDWSVVVGVNPRLALVSSAYYLSVVDLTIGREVDRVYGVGYGPSALTSDGKFLLVADNINYTLDVIDLVGLKVVRKVYLLSAMGTGALYQSFGSVVVVGTQAYVTTIFTDLNSPAIAVVDLNTFDVKAIPVPAGYVDISGSLTPNAAATPDGKYVVMVETYNDDGSYHLLYISTASNTVVKDYTLTTDPYGILVNPAGNPQYAYLLGSGTFLFSATVLDLQTGQLLPQTEVEIDKFFRFPTTAAINPEGTKLVVGGPKPGTGAPNPNLVVIDTAKMLTDPSHAIVGQATVAGGVRPYGTAISSVVTTPPPTAPTLTGVTPPSVNNATANVIQITGANFAPGAQVRIGTMPPLPATVNDQNNLMVTVPQNAPAQAKLDLIVTNPNLGGSQAEQYQSGLLAGQFTITANPAFQPKHRFASLDIADWSVAVWDFGQGHMVTAPNPLVPFPIAFNGDGVEIYSPSYGKRGLVSSPQLLDYNPADGTVQAQVPLAGAQLLAESITQSEIAPSLNPATGRHVVYVPVATRSGNLNDLAVEMVDTESSSPTFNQVIRTIFAGLNTRSRIDVWAGAASTPDGKYVYVSYSNNFQYGYAIFDVVHSTVTFIDPKTLGVAPVSIEMYVTPDGQSLLLNALNGSIAVFDISGNNATQPVLVTTIVGKLPIPNATSAYFSSWQVVGNRLFALVYNTIVAFNFDRVHSNFTQLATYGLPTQNNSSLTVSPDGTLIYVPVIDYDEITVLDANLLVGHRPPLVTDLGAFRAPFQVAVSPVLQHE